MAAETKARQPHKKQSKDLIDVSWSGTVSIKNKGEYFRQSKVKEFVAELRKLQKNK
jgi:hypothetical protein